MNLDFVIVVVTCCVSETNEINFQMNIWNDIENGDCWDKRSVKLTNFSYGFLQCTRVNAFYFMFYVYSHVNLIQPYIVPLCFWYYAAIHCVWWVLCDCCFSNVLRGFRPKLFVVHM